MKNKKRPFLLLEVLIAFFLVALCALPLMQPLFAMVRSEYGFVRNIRLDALVNRYYADLLVRFYRGEVAWKEIGHKETIIPTIPLQDEALTLIGYDGGYTIRVAPYANKSGEYSKEFDVLGIPHRHLLEIKYTFTTPGESRPREYLFWLYVQTKSEIRIHEA